MKWLKEYVDLCASTNAELLERETLKDGAVLIARGQTGARGRLGRQWASPAGTQAIISVGLLPQDVSRFGLLPLAAGLALTDALPGVGLKWPNDGLVEGKKIAGILCEAAADAASPCGMRVVIGMGINVTDAPLDTATCVQHQGWGLSVEEVVHRVLGALSVRVEQWAAGRDIVQEYSQVCTSVGQRVRLQAPGGDVVGKVDRISSDGSLIIAGKSYSAGDVTHLRPA